MYTEVQSISISQPGHRVFVNDCLSQEMAWSPATRIAFQLEGKRRAGLSLQKKDWVRYLEGRYNSKKIGRSA